MLDDHAARLRQSAAVIRRTRPDCSDAEIALRVDLAAAFRLAARAGWDDQLATHMSARVPGSEVHFLINPYGLLFEEITASSLVKIDLAGNPVGPGPAPVNRAGFVIHSAIHAARADAACIVHLHTVAGTAVSAQAAGLLPISPQAMSLHGSIGYHDFEGVTVREDEQARIVASLGSHRALFFRNHGTLTVGRSVAEAYDRMYMLERACQIQVAALSGGGALVQPPREVCEAVAPQLAVIADIPRMTWAALLRRLERTEPGYRD